VKNREEYIDKLAAQLKEWSAKIDELEGKARATKDDVKIKYEKHIRGLRDQREAATKKLQELKGASGEAWDTMKSGVETAWANLRTSISEAKQKFDKPGKPKP